MLPTSDERSGIKLSPFQFPLRFKETNVEYETVPLNFCGTVPLHTSTLLLRLVNNENNEPVPLNFVRL